MFSDIDVSDPDFVVLTLAETGERIRLPRYREKFDLLFEKSDTEKVKEMEIACGAGETAEVRYELTPAEAQVAIECISHSAYKVSVDEGDRENPRLCAGRSGGSSRSAERDSGFRIRR